MWIYFLRWLQSVKHYWKQADNIMGKNVASKRNVNSHKDYLQMKQSYRVRLGMFNVFIGILSFALKLFQSLCVH